MRLAALSVLPALLLACSEPAAPPDKSGDADEQAQPAQPAAPEEPADAPGAEPKVDPDLHDAYDKICNAAERSGGNAETDPSERAVKVAGWIKAEVTNKEALDLMGSLATMDPGRRADALRDAAKRAGVDPCPMADES